MEYKDYYQILGVDKSASQEEIQKAYKKLARKHHPDVNRAEGAEDRFKDIGEAYEVLKDPEKRAKYDQFGQAWKHSQGAGGGGFQGAGGFQGFPGFEGFDVGGGGGGVRFDTFGGGGGGSGFSSFFDMLFGRGAPAGSGGFDPRDFTSGPRRGADQRSKLQLGVEQAARGGEREIHLSDPQGGTRKLRVKIPPGILPGKRIRLAGQGQPAPAGGEPGDLFLEIELRPSSKFRLVDRDLHVKVPISPWEAALGGEILVPTLDGSVRVKVPAGTPSGRKIRLRGKGYPANGAGPGDLFAELQIVVPDSLDETERELFEQLAAKSKFRPRGS